MCVDTRVDMRADACVDMCVDVRACKKRRLFLKACVDLSSTGLVLHTVRAVREYTCNRVVQKEYTCNRVVQKSIHVIV